jgi:rubrerythrin
MESDCFEKFKQAYLTVTENRTKAVVREIALDELNHKYTLEKAFFEETVALHDAGGSSGPVMELTLMLEERPLDERATEQDVLINAIHEKKRIADFYCKMAEQCGGAPMEGMYRQLFREERDHLARLEEHYEDLYLQHM